MKGDSGKRQQMFMNIWKNTDNPPTNFSVVNTYGY